MELYEKQPDGSYKLLKMQPTEKARKCAEDYKFFRELTKKEDPTGQMALSLLREVAHDSPPGEAWK